MSENFQLVQIDDVIAFDQLQKADIAELVAEILETLETPYLFRADDFISSLVEQLSIDDKAKSILKEGIVCRTMSPSKQGWTKGRLKLGLQFIPDANKNSDPLDEIRNTSI